MFLPGPPVPQIIRESVNAEAIGVANERLDCTLRFSFSVETQIEQLKQTITELKQLVPVLARYTRR